MSYIVNGKPVKSVGIITEPSSYGTDITPEDMQSGRTAVSKGKIITGTGRAFEFAVYGQEDLDAIYDENGNDVYGIMLQINPGCNILFVSTNSNGDAIVQDSFIVDVPNTGDSVKIATNKTSTESIRAFYIDGRLRVYGTTFVNANTSINYFIGKDNII